MNPNEPPFFDPTIPSRGLTLGHGIGLRKEHYDELGILLDRVDWLEIVSENFMGFGGRPARVLDQCVERVPVVPHGVSLSVGGPDPLCPDYLAHLHKLCRRIRAPFFSDHLCYSSANQTYFHDLLPLPFTEEAVRHVGQRAKMASEVIEIPLVLENVSFYAVMPGSEMTEAEFIAAVLEEADCGLLLDVNNVYVNAVNHGYDPIEFIDQMPLHRVVQVHLAGHRDDGELLIDDHGSSVIDPVWALYKELVRRIGSVSTLIEWDHNVPTLDTLLSQSERAQMAENEALETRRSLSDPTGQEDTR